MGSVSGVILISTFCGWAAEGPAITDVDRIWPVGMKRGTTATFTIDGRNLTHPRPVLFDTKGITAKVISLTDIPEPKREIRLNVDTKAAVPEGKKQQAKVEVTASPDLDPGIHWFRLQTPLGTSNAIALDVSALPRSPHRSGAIRVCPCSRSICLRRSLGQSRSQGEVHNYQFKEAPARNWFPGARRASGISTEIGSDSARRHGQGGRSGRLWTQRRCGATYKLPSGGVYTSRLLTANAAAE